MNLHTSGLSWIQCQPCIKCYKQDDPIFDPTKSKTYERVLCSDKTRCDKGRECQQGSCIYHLKYEDGATSQGILSRENFTLTSSTNEKFIFRTTFGCSDYTQGNYDAPMAGILGMDLDPESLMSQLAKDSIDRFSYCLVDQDPEPSGHSYLRFDSNMYGGGTDLKKTPLVRHPGDFGYYVILEDISIGNVRLGYPKGTFTFKPDGSGGCMIDSGTPMTLIENGAYLRLAATYEAHFERRAIRRMECPPDNGLTDQDIRCFELLTGFKDLPSLTFHFAQGADFYVDPKYAFTVEGDEGVEVKFFYPNVKPIADTSLIGSLHTANMRLIFDNEIHQLAFAPEKCTQDKGLL